MVLSSEIIVTLPGLEGVSLISLGIAVGVSVNAYTLCETVSVIHV